MLDMKGDFGRHNVLKQCQAGILSALKRFLTQAADRAKKRVSKRADSTLPFDTVTLAWRDWICSG